MFARVAALTERPSGTKVHLQILPGDPLDYVEAMRRSRLLGVLGQETSAPGDRRPQPSRGRPPDPRQRRAVQGTVLDVGSLVVVGDDDWGVVGAEVVEHDRESGSLVPRLLGDRR